MNSFYKEFIKGQCDLTILEPNRYYKGLAIESKNLNNKGAWKKKQFNFLKGFEIVTLNA